MQSGTAQLADFDRAAAGMLSYQEPYTDTDVPKIESLPNEALHRNVDIEVIKADADGYVKTYIIFPGVVCMGYSNRSSGGQGCTAHALYSNALASPGVSKERPRWVRRVGQEYVATRRNKRDCRPIHRLA